MRVKVILEATDLNTGEKKVLADGPAILNGDELLYTEKDTNARHKITFSDEVIIERKAEISSRTVIREGKRGESVVSSEFGDMKMLTEGKMKTHSKTAWLVEYLVISENETVLRQRLEWKISHFS